MGEGTFDVTLLNTEVRFIDAGFNTHGTLNLGNSNVYAINFDSAADLTINNGMGGFQHAYIPGGNLTVNGAVGDWNYMGPIVFAGQEGDTANNYANDAYIESIVTDCADTYFEWGGEGFGNLTTGGSLTVNGGTGFFNSIQNWGGPSEVNLGGGSFNSVVLTGGDSNVFRGGFEVEGEEIYGQLVRMRSDNNRIELQDADINAVELRGDGNNTVIGGSQDIDFVRMDEGNNHLEVNDSRMRFVNMGDAVDQENDGNRVIGGDARIETLRMGASTNHITIGDGDIRDIRVFDNDDFKGSLVLDATGGGRVDAIHSSAATNQITFGTGDIRQINIDDNATAVIDQTGGGRLDVLRSFADTLTFTGGTRYIDMMKLGDGDETIHLNGGAGMIDVGRGYNIVNVNADFLDSISGHSEGSHDLNVAEGAGVGQARLRGDTLMNVNGWVGMARLSDEGDTVNVSDTGEMGSLRLNGGANFLNVDGGRIDQVFSYNDADTLNMTGGRINMVNLDGGDNEFNVSGGRIDTIRAYDGDDTVEITGGEVSKIEMGSGTNRITVDVDNGGTLIETHGGRDRVTTESYFEFIRTGDNRDVVTVNGGATMISTGSGKDDVIQGVEFIEGIRTGDGRDRVIVGEGGANFIKTGDGLDFIDASASYVQFIWMGDDNDRLQLGADGVGMARMGSGNDRIFVDQLNTFAGGLMHGGSGEDTLDFTDYGHGITFSLDLSGQYQALPDQDGGVTEDQVAYVGEISIERLTGSRFDDVLTAEDQGDVFGTSNTLNGLSGNDILISLGTGDFLNGGGGVDQLFGGDGVDVLRGDGGRDTLQGDAGDDRLYGGTSVDTFVFLNDGQNGADRIKDWEDGTDLIDLSDFGFASFAEVEAIASATGGVNTRLNFGDGNQVVIENLLVDDFDATDVIL